MDIRKALGPHSGALRIRSLDGRTTLAKFTKAIRQDLTAALGGTLGAGQSIIVDLCVVKAARLQMLSEQILSGELPPEEAERRFIWHANSLRRDLMALGLDKPSKAPPESLAEYLKGHAA